METITVGDATVTRVEEFIDTTFTAKGFFAAGYDPEGLRPHLGWLVPKFYIPERDALVFSMHSWLVRTGRHTVLIDTCVGNDKERMPREHWHHRTTPFLDRLRAAGARAEDIDYVMCTHLHADHVGWNTVLRDGRWVPTFPNATYVFARVEYDHWHKNPDPNPIRRAGFLDSVLPVAEAGKAQLVDDGFDIDGALSVHLAPGHTPGNAYVRLRSKGTDAMFAGDSIHHPMQVYRTAWSTVACSDPVAAAVSRRRMLEECVARGTLLLPAHFPPPYGAYVQPAGGEFALRWLA